VEYVLRTFGVSKKYKRQFAVNQASMNIGRGEIYGFVGENGSGKTTIIRLITGLIHPDAGSFELFGVPNNHRDIGLARRKIGAVVETPSLYRNMSARDNLKMQCALLGVEESRILPTLQAVGLEYLYNEKKQAGNFSLGMRQRLGIAMALLGEPELLILDEPMNGLDPAGIVEIRELILKLNREKGITFLISSHILTELALVANKYGIISKGHIIQEITAQQLHEICGKAVVLRSEDPQGLMALLRQAGYPAVPEGNNIRIPGEGDLNALLKLVLESGQKLLSVNCTETGFEEYYLSLVGGGHRG
jgi:ABC-2 type transport system ATP-binding protein